jgi:DNA-binding SARP family transcriptional activator/ABC-type branched-subunit amino acid transport system substrate-binding protein
VDDGGSISFRILGQVEASDATGPVALGGAKPRALLAVLLLERGAVVSSDRLVDALWGDQPPPTATKSLQAHVSHLRKSLGPAVVETRAGGYRIAPGAGTLDLDQFEGLTKHGRAAAATGDHDAAAAALGKALALWRGPALGDLAFEPFAAPAVARLEELRLAALEDRFDADLARGRDAELVSELTAFVDEHPLRERMRGQLMLALYRAGRQADALEVYRTGRETLLGELGLEPGPQLRDLERRILTQDETLGGPRRRGPQRPARRRRAKRLIGIGAIVGAAALAAAIVAITSGGDSEAAALLPPGSVAELDPSTGKVVRAATVPGVPGRLATADGQLWVGADSARTITALDVSGLTPSQVAAPRAFPADLALGFGALWVADRAAGIVSVIDPTYGEARKRIALPRARLLDSTFDRIVFDPWSIAAGAGRVWVTDGSARLFEIDPVSRRVARVRPMDVGLDGVAVGQGQLWVISDEAQVALRLEPRTGRVLDRMQIAGRPGFRSPAPIRLAVGRGAVWVLNANTATVTRIDPESHAIAATIPVGFQHGPLGIAATDASAFVGAADGTVTRIDARTNATTTFPVAHRVIDVASSDNRLWITTGIGPGPAPVQRASDLAGRVTPMPPTFCTPVYGPIGKAPDALIVSDLPTEGDSVTGQIVVAIRQALADRGFKAGKRTIGYQACDDTITRPDPEAFTGKCVANATAYAGNASVLGVIGPYQSLCAQVALPMLNQARGGPLAAVSPSTTYVGLTHRGPGAQLGDPAVYRPTGQRNFARLIAADDVQSAALAIVAQRLGLKRVFAIKGDGAYGDGLVQGFTGSARALGIHVVGSALANGNRSYLAIARQAARAHADGAFVASAYNVAETLRALSRTLAPGTPIIGSDSLDVFPELAQLGGASTEGLTITVPGPAVSALPAKGRRFAARLKATIGGREPHPFAIYAAEATNDLLDAIGRSDGSRASVTRELFRTRVRDGLLGPYAINANGDMTAGEITVYRVHDRSPRVVGVITPPARLVGGAGSARRLSGPLARGCRRAARARRRAAPTRLRRRHRSPRRPSRSPRSTRGA